MTFARCQSHRWPQLHCPRSEESFDKSMMTPCLRIQKHTQNTSSKRNFDCQTRLQLELFEVGVLCNPYPHCHLATLSLWTHHLAGGLPIQSIGTRPRLCAASSQAASAPFRDSRADACWGYRAGEDSLPSPCCSMAQETRLRLNEKERHKSICSIAPKYNTRNMMEQIPVVLEMAQLQRSDFL